MILVLLLLLVPIPVGIVFLLLSRAKRNKYPHRDYNNGEGWLGFGLAFIVGAVLAILISSACTAGVAYSKRGDANSIYSKIGELTRQRDELIPLVREELSTDEYAALMEATSVESTQIQVLFASDVSAVFLERANRIIGLNQAIFGERNRALTLELQICSARSNPFVPRLPGIFPDCRVDFLDSLQVEPTISEK